MKQIYSNCRICINNKQKLIKNMYLHLGHTNKKVFMEK